MENLLDKAGLTFVASYQCATISGVVHIVEDAVYLIDNTGNSIYVKKGTPDQIKAAHLCNFRLLEPGEPGEPESKEEKIDCPDCQGLGSTYLNKIQEECKRCGGVGVIKEEPTVSKEEAEKETIGEILNRIETKTGEKIPAEIRAIANDLSQNLKEGDKIDWILGYTLGVISKHWPKETLTKRENISTQLLAGMLGNSNFKINEATDHLMLIYVDESIKVTDYLLKKLGE